MYFCENITTKTLLIRINDVDISRRLGEHYTQSYLLKYNGSYDGTLEHHQ
jgi:hypothetical protein